MFEAKFEKVPSTTGGPYRPGGVLSDFEGEGEGGVPKVYNRTDPKNFVAFLFLVPSFQAAGVNLIRIICTFSWLIYWFHMF